MSIVHWHCFATFVLFWISVQLNKQTRIFDLKENYFYELFFIAKKKQSVFKTVGKMFKLHSWYISNSNEKIDDGKNWFAKYFNQLHLFDEMNKKKKNTTKTNWKSESNKRPPQQFHILTANLIFFLIPKYKFYSPISNSNAFQ